jgi:hypothetical protein
MKPHILRLAAAIVCALPLSAAAQAPAITGISVSGDRAILQWEGGAPPFEVQSSIDMHHWTPRTRVVESALSVPDNGAAAFFKVVGEHPMSGRFVGQLRVDEGEFGKPLARHRLKSLWDFHEPPLGIGEPTHIPKDYFLDLNLRLIHREGDGLGVFTGKLEDLPGSRITTKKNSITVSWTFGAGRDRRDYVLNMKFPSSYDITIGQRTICLSMPDYILTCSYAVAQPEEGYDKGRIIEKTFKDEVSLYQISDDPVSDWLRRDFSIHVGGVTFASQYVLGVPVFQCGTAFIWKTPVLDEWGTTTITGLTTEPLVLADRFAQTYKPGHHNFWETFWIEPALIPGLSAQQRQELRDADILFIVVNYPSAFPSSPTTIQLVGFDWKVRDL